MSHTTLTATAAKTSRIQQLLAQRAEASRTSKQREHSDRDDPTSRAHQLGRVLAADHLNLEQIEKIVQAHNTVGSTDRFLALHGFFMFENMPRFEGRDAIMLSMVGVTKLRTIDEAAAFCRGVSEIYSEAVGQA